MYLISIHVPREGHDTLTQPPFFYNYIFQSTCPARGTTFRPFVQTVAPLISIHVPREGHDLHLRIFPLSSFAISIHVPREGHDFDMSDCKVILYDISIHVPREGHDQLHIASGLPISFYFNPRAPRGARLYI